MIPLIGLLFCIYLVFKGFEIFQIAWCAQPRPASGVIIGVGAIVASIAIASVFAFLFIYPSFAPVPTGTPNLPNLP
jgi:hypothetical protein